jgi:hypothetical protein
MDINCPEGDHPGHHVDFCFFCKDRRRVGRSRLGCGGGVVGDRGNNGVSSYQIHAIATRALLDPEFRKAILNGQRRQKLQEFDLPSELVDVILSIEGNDIHQFIFGLNNLATSKQDQTTPREWKTMPVQMHCSHEQEEVRPANS